MKKIRIGVFGAYRGTSMINYCKMANDAEVVAICDKSEDAIQAHKSQSEGLDITYYYDFKDFIKHDMDAVVLANYAHEHAPFAIKCMEAGKHVFSEVLPVQTMKEAVELVEAVERTGMVYAYGENYCFRPATAEMSKIYKEGGIGEFEYGECEYVHNCESIWPGITYGEEDHWRNNDMYSTFYCTHSLGPIIHATKLRPVSVIGFEGTKNARNLRVGAKGGQFGIEMVTLENGGLIKSIHGGLYTNSIWYCMYGSKGSMESTREIKSLADQKTFITVKSDKFDGAYEIDEKTYQPINEFTEISKKFGHGGSDYYTMHNFIEKINGNENADIIDVYEALDMFLPGMFAFRSILNGGKSMEIPNLRDKSIRDAWRNDTACTRKEVAGDMLLPTFSKGTPVIDKSVYDHIKDLWAKELDDDNSYRKGALFKTLEKSDS